MTIFGFLTCFPCRKVSLAHFDPSKMTWAMCVRSGSHCETWILLEIGPEAIMVQVQPEDDAETCPGVKEASEPVPLLLRHGSVYHLDRYSRCRMFESICKSLWNFPFFK